MKKQNDLFALPYVHGRDGKAFVRINYQDRKGKWKSKERRVSTVNEAIAAVADIKHQIGLAGPGAFDGERMTFADLLAEYKRAHPELPAWYEAPMKEFFGLRRIRSITYGNLREFKTARAEVPKVDGKNRKPATVNREMEHLRAVLLYAVRHGWLQKNPFAADEPLIVKAEEEDRTVVPTPAEEARLLAHCVPPREHLRSLIIATRDTGLRKSALLSIEWQHVDLGAGIIRVPKARSRRKGRPHVIALTARLWTELRSLFGEGKPPEAKVFGVIEIPGEEDGEIKTRQIAGFKRAWQTACRLAGIEGLVFNDFRHGFATDLMEAGVPERLAMKAAGHASVATHSIYTNVDERLARQLAEALDRLHASRQPAGLADVPPASSLVN